MIEHQSSPYFCHTLLFAVRILSDGPFLVYCACGLFDMVKVNTYIIRSFYKLVLLVLIAFIVRAVRQTLLSLIAL